MLQGGSIPGCEGGDISNQPTFVFINIKYAPSYNFIIKDNGHNKLNLSIISKTNLKALFRVACNVEWGNEGCYVLYTK